MSNLAERPGTASSDWTWLCEQLQARTQLTRSGFGNGNSGWSVDFAMALEDDEMAQLATFSLAIASALRPSTAHTATALGSPREPRSREHLLGGECAGWAPCLQPASGRWNFRHSELAIIGPCGTLMAATWGADTGGGKEGGAENPGDGWRLDPCLFYMTKCTPFRKPHEEHTTPPGILCLHQCKPPNYLSVLINGLINLATKSEFI